MVWFLAGFIGLTLLINYLSLAFGLRKLTYRLVTDKDTYEIGQEILVTSIVENDKPLMVSFLDVQEHFPSGFNVAFNAYTLLIMPFQRIKRTYKVTGARRGLYTISYTTLTLGDFIGFDCRKRTELPNREIVILPPKIALAELITPLGQMNGDLSVKRWILDDPLMFLGVREYTGTEPQKHIHWPSTAKHGKLMVKQFDFTTDNRVLILLNTETSLPGARQVEEAIIEKAIVITRALMEQFDALGIPYGLASNAYNELDDTRGYYIRPGLGPGHLSSLLKTLGSLDYKVSRFFSSTLRDAGKGLGNFSTVVIVTPRILDWLVQPIEAVGKAAARTALISVEGQGLERFGNSIMKFRGIEL